MSLPFLVGAVAAFVALLYIAEKRGILVAGVALLLIAALVGCAPIPLGTAKPVTAKSEDRQKADWYECRDQAESDVVTAKNLATSMLLGVTLIGYPLAQDYNKRVTQEAFAKCMSGRGYAVTLPAD